MPERPLRLRYGVIAGIWIVVDMRQSMVERACGAHERCELAAPVQAPEYAASVRID